MSALAAVAALARPLLTPLSLVSAAGGLVLGGAVLFPVVRDSGVLGQPRTDGGLALYGCPGRGAPLGQVGPGQDVLVVARSADGAWYQLHFGAPAPSRVWGRAAAFELRGDPAELPVAECVAPPSLAAAQPTFTAFQEPSPAVSVSPSPSPAVTASPSASPSASPTASPTPVVAGPPRAPSDLVATLEDRRPPAVLLRWRDRSDDETRFRVYLGGELLREVRAADGGRVTMRVTDLRYETELCFSVTAWSRVTGASAPSNEACVTTPPPPPEPPTGVHAYSDWPDRIDVEWSDTSEPATEYRVYLGDEVVAVVDRASGAPPYASIKGLDSGTRYCFEVRAWYAEGGESAPSAEACAETVATVPDAPSDLVATPSEGEPAVALEWRDRSGDEDGFTVYVLAAETTMSEEVGRDVTEHVVDSLAPDTRYCFWVTAFNEAGESDPSNGTDEVCVRTSGSVPG